MAVALLTVAENVPIFVFSVIGGVLADRWNPKRTMIAGDLMSAASVGVILWLLTKGWWEAVYVATFVSAVVGQLSQPSSARIFKRHVPDGDVSAAVGLSQSLISLFLSEDWFWEDGCTKISVCFFPWRHPVSVSAFGRDPPPVAL